MQKSFSDLGYAANQKLTRRDRFLAEIDSVTPWGKLHKAVEPFYPKVEGTFRNLGCAAMFIYLTGFQAAEVRPFQIDDKMKEGVLVANAKRKKGQAEVLKLREWSTKLRVVVARAEQTHSIPRQFLFANSVRAHAHTHTQVTQFDSVSTHILQKNQCRIGPQECRSLLMSAFVATAQ